MNMKDIASLADVSKATVSRVINNPELVSEKLRKKVQKVLKETGYTPNLIARELVTKKTKLIGVIFPKVGIDTFSKITEGIMDKLNEEGYDILLASSRESMDEEFKYLNIFKKKYVDGIIFFPTVITKKHIEVLNNLNIPLVLMGQINEEIKASSVLFKDLEASKEVVKYLISKEHKKIAYIGFNKHKSIIARKRKEGYIQTLKENNIDINDEYIAKGYFDMKSGYEQTKEIFSKSSEFPTAIFAATDRLAFGAIKYLKEIKLNVPNDVSIISIDDMEISHIFSPSLTTIRFDYYNSGISASDLILKKIINKDQQNEDILIGYKLIKRESVKKQ
ncbi:LacI family DNA-binding transcriptional regulator [Peptostreptococcaceae bacterium AGR-M142]